MINSSNPLFNSLPKEINTCLSKLNNENHREIKEQLIALQQKVKEASLPYELKKEINETLQNGFSKIHNLRQELQDAFEAEAMGNYYEIIDEVKDTVQFAINHHDAREAWDKLMELQNTLRPLKLLRHHREEVVRLMNEAFDTLKQKRGIVQQQQHQQSDSGFESLLNLSNTVLHQAQHEPDLQKAKNAIFELLEVVKSTHLIKPHREEISKNIQEAFTWIDLRKSQEKDEKQAESARLKQEILSFIEQGRQMAETATEFNPVWDYLKNIQSQIRSSNLTKEHRDHLFTTVQQAFEILKSRQETFYNDLHKEAIDNYKMLKEKVEKASKMAQSSLELKKAKDYVKSVQAEFKGLKLRKEEREELYQKISKAFDTISQRIDTHIATKKETTRLRSGYQISELEYSIAQIKQEIEKDHQMIESLEERKEVGSIDHSAMQSNQELDYQIEVLKASIRHKNQQLQEHEEKLSHLMEKKQTWEQIEENPDNQESNLPLP